MTLFNIKTTISCLALIIAASSSVAAPTAGPKPKCHNMGEIPVLENGMWKCKQPSIKAKENGMRSTAGGTQNKLTVKKPARAMPDLTIVSITKVPNTTNQFKVKVQNIGTGTSTGGVLLGQDMTGQGGGGTKPLPTLKPTFFSVMDFEVPSQNIDRGDRIKFFADANKQVSESNENNNIKYYTVKTK